MTWLLCLPVLVPIRQWTAVATGNSANVIYRTPSNFISTRPVELLKDNKSGTEAARYRCQHEDETSSVTSIQDSSNDRRKEIIENQLKKASMLAFANLVINALRPDRWLPLPVRLPRFIWEAAIIATCRSAHHSTTSLLVLSIMTLAAALTDIFVGAPIAAMFVQWETCEGGRLFGRGPQVCYPDPVKGYGRLLVTLQCACTGVVYLETAMICYDAYQRRQREETVGLQKRPVEDVISAFR